MRRIQSRFQRAAPPNELQTSQSAAGLKWYQVIALAIHDHGDAATVDEIIAHPLVRYKYAAQAIPTPVRQVVWGTLGHHTVESSTTVNMKRRTGELLFDKREGGTWVLAEKLPEDLAAMVAQSNPEKRPATIQDFSFITFHQSYSYEDFIEGIRPQVTAEDEESSLNYVLEDGLFKRAVRSALILAGHDGSIDEFCRLGKEKRLAMLKDAKPFAIFIDEINRGNVARIFGELITLIEPDKRLSAENELIVDLPQSRTKFGVPSNLFIYGTMNTADRSVEALDAALRRRFDFEELAPKPELLRSAKVEGGIDVERMMRTINERLEKLYDRDHRIGHAYFMPLLEDNRFETLKAIFANRLVPLLQEYFFGDWGKIGLVLGKSFVVRRDRSTVSFADFDHEEREAFTERPSWELVDMNTISDQAFRRIYEHVEEA